MGSRKLKWAAIVMVACAAFASHNAWADDKKITVAFSQIGAASEWPAKPIQNQSKSRRPPSAAST